MQLDFILRLLSVSIRKRWRGYLAMIAGMTVGTLALGLAVVVGPGVGRSVQAHLKDLFPAERVLLRPRALSLIWLQVETTTITPATVQAVRALPGVVRVSPEATIRFPISAEGTLMGNTLRTEVSVTGVEGWLLGDDEPTSFTYNPASGRPMPAVLSQYFLDLYNMSYAESNSLPKLTPFAVVGRNFNLILGESTIMSRNMGQMPREVPCRIVGLSRNPDLLGLAFPLEAVEDLNRQYGLKNKKYRTLHVELESPEAVDAIRDNLKALGLKVLDRNTHWKRLSVIVRLVGFGFVGLGGLVFVLALAYMTSSVNGMLSRRRREMAVLRAVGASSAQVALLLAVEIALAGGLGVGAGIGAVAVAMAFVDRWYQVFITGWTFLPADLFAVPWTWMFLSGLACWSVAVAFTLKPVLAGAREPIASALWREE